MFLCRISGSSHSPRHGHCIQLPECLQVFAAEQLCVAVALNNRLVDEGTVEDVEDSDVLHTGTTMNI